MPTTTERGFVKTCLKDNIVMEQKLSLRTIVRVISTYNHRDMSTMINDNFVHINNNLHFHLDFFIFITSVQVSQLQYIA